MQEEQLEPAVSDVWAMSDKFEMDVREGEVGRVEGGSRRERESTREGLCAGMCVCVCTTWM